MTIAQAIRRAAKDQGCTLTALRIKAGVSERTLFYLLRSEHEPSLPTLRKLKGAGIQIPPKFLDAA